MTGRLGITELHSYVPDTRIGVKEIIESTPLEKIRSAFRSKEELLLFAENILKLEAVPVHSEGPAQLLESTLESFFEKRPVSRENVDLIVLLNEYSFLKANNVGQRLIRRFSMKGTRLVSLAGNHCANLEMAFGFFMEHDVAFDNILLLGGNKVPNITDRVYGSFGIVGDGAGAILLSRDRPKLHLKRHASIMIPEMSDGQTGDEVLLHNFNGYTRTLDTALAKALEPPDGVSKAVIQNANPLLPVRCLKAKGIREEQIYADQSSQLGHLGLVDSIVNLEQVIRLGDLSAGDRILTLVTGMFGTYAANLFLMN